MPIRIRSKNSVVKDKAPLPADLEIGELALNAHQDSPAIYLKDAAGAIRKVAGDATTTAKGIVQLADATAVTAGTAGRVVDAKELKDSQVFLQDGTDAKPRTYLSKLKDVVSVKDFGAKGDNVADDTAAIQAAINYVQSFYKAETYASLSPGPGAAELFFPFGAYKITAALTVTRSISFRGEGHSEFSIGARIIQKTAATDHFKVSPIAQGCSVSWDNLTMTADGGGGTGGACINITKTPAACNSVRIRGCTFGTPQSYAIKLQGSDDVMITGNLVDVCAQHGIALGTAAATDIVSNCVISGNSFYSVNLNIILLYNVTGLIVSSNRVFKATQNAAAFIEGQDTLPYQIKNVIVSQNTITGADCIARVSAVQGFALTDNIGSDIGAGAGATKSWVELHGACSKVVVSRNVISGAAGGKSAYEEARGSSIAGCVVSNNSFTATGGSASPAISPSVSSALSDSVIESNSCTGFSTASIGSILVTSGSAIAVGVIAALTSKAYKKTIVGAKQGDHVNVTPIGTTWPCPVGISVAAYVSNADEVTLEYTNLTAAPVGVPAHDFAIRVSR